MTVLEIENVSKKYRRGELGRGSVGKDFVSLFRNGQEFDPTTDFWALKDINFNVAQGEIVGIIGNNGAGKSTLLKLLSQITGPTEGCIRMKGKVASLLEVGTGMHPDLTGMENIYLNAAILGMDKAEIDRKFDEIIAFSECWEAINTPLKRYSSGMKVRLGFSVAVFLEPTILIIDEVLAVGDARFQTKAIAKVQEIVANKDKTVLIVSHNMAAIKSLCKRCILLDSGKMIYDGDVDVAISKYLGYDVNEASRIREWMPENAPGNGEVQLHKAQIFARGKQNGDAITTEDALSVRITLFRADVHRRVDCTIQLLGSQGEFLAAVSTNQLPDTAFAMEGNITVFSLEIPANIFNQGTYRINVLLLHDRRSVIMRFDDLLRLEFTAAARDSQTWMGHTNSFFLPQAKWLIG